MWVFVTDKSGGKVDFENTVFTITIIRSVENSGSYNFVVITSLIWVELTPSMINTDPMSEDVGSDSLASFVFQGNSIVDYVIFDFFDDFDSSK